MRIERPVAALLAPLLLLTACSPQAASDAPPARVTGERAVHPVSGLEVIPLTIDTGEQVHDFRVELAASPEEQRQGLMFRTQMGPNEGMLFPTAGGPAPRSFWMRNTVLPLDIIFIGEDRRILNIAEHTVPYSEAPIPSSGEALAVLELNAGRSAELGIEAGDLVEW